MPGIWWRVTWMEAVWSSELKPLERLVAAVYADHARETRTAWVTLDRLCERTGLSRDAAHRALKGVEDAGWLMTIERRPRRSVTYFLVIPDHARSTGDGLSAGTPDGLRTEIGSTSPDAGSTSPDTGGTRGVLHPSSTDPYTARARECCDALGFVQLENNTVAKCPQHHPHLRSA